jgi:hypothetical protein
MRPQYCNLGYTGPRIISFYESARHIGCSCSFNVVSDVQMNNVDIPRGSIEVKALCYTLKGRGFETRCSDFAPIYFACDSIWV